MEPPEDEILFQQALDEVKEEEGWELDEEMELEGWDSDDALEWSGEGERGKHCDEMLDNQLSILWLITDSITRFARQVQSYWMVGTSSRRGGLDYPGPARLA